MDPRTMDALCMGFLAGLLTACLAIAFATALTGACT